MKRWQALALSGICILLAANGAYLAIVERNMSVGALAIISAYLAVVLSGVFHGLGARVAMTVRVLVLLAAAVLLGVASGRAEVLIILLVVSVAVAPAFAFLQAHQHRD